MPIIDFTKYVERKQFEENNKLIGKHFYNCELAIEDLQRLFEELNYTLKHNPNNEDFNILQLMIIQKYERFIAIFSKKIYR